MILFLLLSLQTNAWAKEIKGTLPEVSVRANQDEQSSEAKSVAAEVLISKTENQAIATLQKIIAKRKGSAEEPQLWFRLAELYMRRAKTGRFFDLHREANKAVQFVPKEIREQSAKKNIQQGIDIYQKIEKSFPKYVGMDEVLFNNGFAHQGLGKPREAEAAYTRLVTRFPSSVLIPDAHLALGEIAYDAKRFNLAMDHFQQIEKYPNSKVFSYGLYKGAWTLYNLRKNQEAIDKMVAVVKFHDPRQTTTDGQKVNHNLRTEALRDLGIFFGETLKAEDAVAFFAKITTDEELGESLLSLGKLYDGYSKQKEVQIFLNDFIEKYPKSHFVVRMRLLLVDTNETLKNRQEVLSQLMEIAQICEASSAFRKANSTLVAERCDLDFNKVNLDIAKKWWEIWLKNKNHKEFAGLTKRAFEIFVARDPIAKPDTKARFAYAELLFQQNDFRAASVQYEIVGTHSEDTKAKHDSNYAALVSLEKAHEVAKQSQDDAELMRLSQQYLQREPKGAWTLPVSFKIAFLLFQKGKFPEAEKWLEPIARNPSNPELQEKSEDLLLDIYNSRKEYQKIRDFSRSIIESKKSDQGAVARKTKLTGIMQEADLADVQVATAKMPPREAADKFFEFVERNPGSALAKEALWKSISLSYSAARMIDGTERALLFVERYPDDPRRIDALKEAAKTYFDTGNLLAAAGILEKLAAQNQNPQANLELAAEMYRLEHEWKKSRKAFDKAISVAKKDDHNRLWSLILKLERAAKNDKAAKEIEARLEREGVEPYASDARLAKLRDVFSSGDQKRSFELAKNILSSSSTEEVKAEARWIHGQIFESELVSQSLKTTVERLPVVLGLKTEKLDRAQTAYLQVVRMSKSAELQIRALSGLQRVYQNYISSISSLNLKSELTAEEKSILDQELSKVLEPVRKQSVENETKLTNLMKQSELSVTGAIDFQNHPVTEIAPGRILSLEVADLTPVFPFINADGKARWAPIKSVRKSDCRAEKFSPSRFSEAMNACFILRDKPSLDLLIARWTREDAKSIWPLFYHSLSARIDEKHEKALTLIDLSLKKEQTEKGLIYHRGWIHVKMGNTSLGQKDLQKAFDLGLDEGDTRRVSALNAYSVGDYAKYLKLMETIPSQQRSRPEFRLLDIEALLKSGNRNAALKLTNDTGRREPTSTSKHEWINKRIEFLKSELSKKEGK